MTHPMHDRVASAIARVTASRAAGEVLAEIERTHVLVERERFERLRDAAGMAADEWGADSRVGLLPGDLEPL